MTGYSYIFGTLLFTVYGQLIIKWRIYKFGQLPPGNFDKIIYLLNTLIDPYILSGLFSAFIASLFWIAAMTKFEITKAYPFMSLAPAFVLVLGVLFLNETFTWGKLCGLIVIILGIIITVKF